MLQTKEGSLLVSGKASRLHVLLLASYVCRLLPSWIVICNKKGIERRREWDVPVVGQDSR